MIRFRISGAVILLLIAISAVYVPGLSGDFLLDDYHTLEPLGASGGIDSLSSLSDYVFSGTTGPTGRPLSSFTFVLNAQTWPADPFPFLVTNAAIHAFNACLMFIFLFMLLNRRPNDVSRTFAFSFCCALLWGLHPIQVSSVLYVVQRMTLLSSMFSLVVLILYLEGRCEAERGRILNAAIYTGFCGVGAIAAVTSKENAILLPLQILLVESYLRWTGHKMSSFNRIVALFVVSPAALIVVGYMIHLVAADLLAPEALEYGRGFSMYERVLTEARILVDYLYDLAIPKMQSAGVFHDNYPISKGLLDPPTTLLWVLLHTFLLAAAVCIRRRLPMVALGILWFYLGHLIESTIIMLELKFEHRNYLASLGFVLAVASGAEALLRRNAQRMAAILTAVLYGFILFGATSLWGRPLEASRVWAEENSDSGRAWENAALKNLNHDGPLKLTKAYMSKLVEVEPTATNKLKYILAFCETHNDETPNWSELADGVRTGPRDWSLHKVIADLLAQRVSGGCKMVDFQDLLALTEAYRGNSVYRNQLTQLSIDETEYRAALHSGQGDKVKDIELRYDQAKTPLRVNLHRAGLLATFGYLELAHLRLSEALLLARDGRATETELDEAAEVLVQIEKDLDREGK